jgi:hypothetical protein
VAPWIPDFAGMTSLTASMCSVGMEGFASLAMGAANIAGRFVGAQQTTFKLPKACGARNRGASERRGPEPSRG